MQAEIITKLIEHVKSECTQVDQEARYNDMLDECYSFELVGGIFASMSPSRVLKEVDPTAYHCGMNDYFGNGEQYEIDGELYDTDPVDEAREGFTDSLESEISDLESEIEEMEGDEGHNISELAALQRKLMDLEADLKTVKDYSF